MIPEKSLVIYKNRPALVSGFDGEKINITVMGGDSHKVRDKDIELIHPGPCVLKDLECTSRANVREAWELLTGNEAVSLKELAELAYGDFSPANAWAAWELLREGLYFTGDAKAIKARPEEIVMEEEKKREEKLKESEDRSAFLEKLKKLPPLGDNQISAVNRRFIQDVEALARGQTDKSRTLKELGRQESPEEAHRLLLAAGVWTVWDNPHPERFGLCVESSKLVPRGPPEEDRLDLTGLAAYAIDSPWSNDPDDALSLEGPDEEGRYCLWVHVADPASSVEPGSPADLEARGRGASLYLPEGASRMLAPEALSLFSLGYTEGVTLGAAEGCTELSPALSFKISLKPDLTIEETEVHPSLVRVRRLTYAGADELIAGNVPAGEEKAAAILSSLASLAARNVERRLDTGAVMIELPEVHISVKPDSREISVEPIGTYRSAEMVRECMLLAGEGTARWALQNKLPFPFISQEAGELPEKRLLGLAGAWQLRRCMRPRSLSAKPAVHWGLGLDEYTQVTSPLRRYTDLLCHQQIRAWIGKNTGSGPYKGIDPLAEEEVLLRAAAAEAASGAVNRAERASRAHWLAVYLSDKKDSLWDGVLLDRKGNRGTVLIPALGLETQVNLRGSEEVNGQVRLKLSSVKIPEGEVSFAVE